MINFYMPDFVNNAGIICFLADMMKQAPQWFYEDAKISAAYGCFGSCIWNGGRSFLAKNDSREMAKLIEEYNKRGIAVRYTFTNPLIEEKHLNDTFSNLCLKLADNGMNEVIVNTKCLEDYIRAEYPNFKLISSTTKCISTIEGLNDELKNDYYLVVADSVWNNTDELFALEDKGRIELIADHTCEDNCPRRRQHYNYIGQAMLDFRDANDFKCANIKLNFEDLFNHSNFITVEDVFTRYKDAGFKHFKLDGRCFTVDNILKSFTYYLVKPEYRDKMIQFLDKELYHR